MSTITIGLDVGDRWSEVCGLDADGTVRVTRRVRTTPAALAQWFGAQPVSRVVLEVGTHSPWISRLLGSVGHEVLVANAHQLRLIYASPRKSDRVDAETLARLGRLDPALLKPIRHRGAQSQADLAHLRARDCLVRARTQLINHVRGAVKSVGARLPASSAPAFARVAQDQLPATLRPATLRPALEPLLTLIAGLTQQIRRMEQTLERVVATRYPETRGLRQVAGVGPLTALGYVLTLEDPARFARSRAVGAYLGRCPRQRDSGAAHPQLRITKCGDPLLRRLLVNGAHDVLRPFGPDGDLRRWGLALAARGGTNAKKRAVVAVARKLATLLHRLWVSGARYEPLQQSVAA